MAKKRDVSKFMAGQMARSDAGHDRGKLYVILEVVGETVLLADGIHKTIEKPKKKKLKHLKPIDWLPDDDVKLSQDKLTNRFIREAVNALKIEELVTE